MSIFRKKVTLLSSIKNNTPEILLFSGIILLVVLLTVKVSPLISLSAAVITLFVCIRLFCGRLKVKSGDVILFWGIPGSGKTMAQNATAAYNKKKFNAVIVGNEEFAETSKIVDAVLPRNAFGFFKCPDNSIICTDEASLNGWDSRDWSKNFCPESLAYWKKIRHYKNAAILTNQGFSELDSKIRDGLTSCIYYCENKGRYSKCIRMDKSVSFSEVTGLPQEGYSLPSIWQRLIDPSCVLYFWHSRSGKLFNSYNPDPLPPLEDLPKYRYIKEKNGGRWVQVDRDPIT